MDKYIIKKQYEQKSWAVELRFPPHLFPLKKGNFIAKSGNTGSSHAPHLHMEIRNTITDKTLNGLAFYPTLKDDKINFYKTIIETEKRNLISIDESGFYLNMSKKCYRTVHKYPFVKLTTI